MIWPFNRPTERQERPVPRGQQQQSAVGGAVATEVRWADGRIETPEGLSGVVWLESVNAQAELGEHLVSRIAVARVSASGNDVVLFADQRNVTTQEVDAVVSHVRRRGFALKRGINAYSVAGSVVASIGKGHITPGHVSRARAASSGDRAGLWQTWLEWVRWGAAHDADDMDVVINVRSSPPSARVSYKANGEYVHPTQFANIAVETALEVVGTAWQHTEGGNTAQHDLNKILQASLDVRLPAGQDLPGGSRLRLRWSTSPTHVGAVVTCRIAREDEHAKVASLDAAGYLPEAVATIRRAAAAPSGLTVFSAPVGQGKTTAIALALREVSPSRKGVSLEEPVELRIPNFHQRELARNLDLGGAIDPAFVAALSAFLRQAPDIVLLGEIRDRQTGAFAQAVADSGHACWTTTHAGSALGTIGRLTGETIGMDRERLAEPDVLRMLVFQKLIRCVCDQCAVGLREWVSSENGLQRQAYVARVLRLFPSVPDARLRFRNPSGCQACRVDGLPDYAGFSRRVPAAELVEVDDDLRACMLLHDPVELRRLWRARANPDLSIASVVGRTALEQAMYLAGRGTVDLHSVEAAFGTFEAEEANRLNPRRVSSKAQPVARGAT